MLLRRPLIASTLLAVSLLPTACSESFPSKDDFVAEAKRAIPNDLSDRIADAKITPEAGNTLIEEHLGCIYDAIKADPDLVNRIVDDPDGPELTEAVNSKAGECTEQANQSILDAVTASTQ